MMAPASISKWKRTWIYDPDVILILASTQLMAIIPPYLYISIDIQSARSIFATMNHQRHHHHHHHHRKREREIYDAYLQRQRIGFNADWCGLKPEKTHPAAIGQPELNARIPVSFLQPAGMMNVPQRCHHIYRDIHRLIELNNFKLITPTSFFSNFYFASLLPPSVRPSTIPFQFRFIPVNIGHHFQFPSLMNSIR